MNRPIKLTEQPGVWRALASGVLLVLLFVPSMQWLDRGTLANPLAMRVPQPLGVGMIVAFVLLNAGFLWAAGRNVVRVRTLLVWYLMLSISLPFCGVGVVAPLFGSLQATAREIFHREEPGNVLHMYAWQDPGFFPKVTDEEFERFMNLRDPAFVQREGIIDPQAESFLAVGHLRQFWDGRNVSPATRQRYGQPGQTTFDLVRLAWGDIPWSVWRPLLLSWGGLLLLAFVGSMLLARVLYRDWTERENLPFPVIQAPLALLEKSGGDGGDGGNGGGARLFRNPFFLGGGLVAGLLLLLSGLAHYQIMNLPATGPVTFQYVDFNQIFLSGPFSVLKRNFLFFSPILVGVAFLIHQEILRGALWVFLALQGLRLLTGVLEPTLSESMGAAWRGNLMPYYLEQGTGAALCFGLVLIWRSRRALWGGGGSDTRSWILRGWPGLLLLLVMAGLVAWMYRMGATGPGGLLVGGLALVWLLVGSVAFARCRTEGGLASAGTSFINAKQIIPGIGFAEHLQADNVRTVATSEWMNMSAFSGLLGVQIEGLYMARRLGVRARTIAWASLLAFGTALIVGLLSYLILAYWQGGLNNDQRLFSGMAVPLWTMGGALEYRQADVDGLWLSMIAVGAVVMLALIGCRKRFARFPIPPICFPLICLGTVMMQTGNDSLHSVYTAGPYVSFIWGPMFIAFLIKKMLLRFGGMDMYVRAIPAAWGLVVGHCLMIVGWSLYHVLAAPENVTLFPGIF